MMSPSLLRPQGISPFEYHLNAWRTPGIPFVHPDFTRENIAQAQAAVIQGLRAGLGRYEPSPAFSMPRLCQRLGIETLVVKEEGRRLARIRDLAVGDRVFDSSAEVPREIAIDVMRGTTLLVAEMLKQVAAPPDVIFLQAGSGMMAGALTVAFRTLPPEDLPPQKQPKIVVCEPVQAARILHSMTRGQGRIDREGFEGTRRTKAAGLACAQPSSVGFEVLRDQADAFMTTAESLIDLGAALMYRETHDVFAHPCLSHETGAFGMACLLAVMRIPILDPLRAVLNLGPPKKDQMHNGKKVWVICTESGENSAFSEAVQRRSLPPMFFDGGDLFSDL